VDPIRPGERISFSGHTLDLVVSQLQKACRRGAIDSALWAASEMDLSGFGSWAWRRLKVIALEDVGLADPQAIVIVSALHETWEAFRKEDQARDRREGVRREPGQPIGGSYGHMCLMMATAYLARAPKSSFVVDATATMYQGERPHRDFPDYVRDRHTLAGRQMGRGVDHFYDESSRLFNVAELEPELERDYRERAREAAKRPSVLRPENMVSRRPDGPEQLELEPET
jgi:replication-associated recombination protein RarA